MPPVPTARELAEWAATLRPEDVPAEVRFLNGARLADTLGLIIAAAGTQAVSAARDMISAWSGNQQSTVIGSKARLPSASAALVHGVAAHCFDFDDTLAESVIHPGSFVIPTALAVAEAHDVPDDEFSAAVTLGYELAARLGAVAQRKFHARQLHPSSIVGPIASAAVAARLMHADAETMSWSMGLAASMSGGLRAYAIDGGWSKWLHLGWAAHGGIVAAELAARGFKGPEFVLNGGSDLYSTLLYGETVDRSVLTAGLGKEWKGAKGEFKYYPCAHVIQPFVDAVLSLMKEQKIMANEIAGIECILAPFAAAIVCEPREAKLQFSTELEATGSLPYQLACAALDGRVGLHSLKPETQARRDLAAFSHRVTHRIDEELGAHFEGVVEITETSGRRHTRTASLPEADGKKIVEKFIALTDTIMPAERALRVAETLVPGAANWREAVSVLREVVVS